MRTVTCTDCGQVLAADGVAPPPEGQPCSACGSTKRTIAIEIEPAVHTLSAGTPTVRVIDYPHVLLQEAQLLIDRRQYGIATMVAHVACEVTVLQALTRAFARKGIPDLEEAISEFFSGYNLGNDRLRGFYTAITGDAIGSRPFGQTSSFRQHGEMILLTTERRQRRQMHARR